MIFNIMKNINIEVKIWTLGFIFSMIIIVTKSENKGTGSLVKRNPCETKDEKIMESFEDKDLHWYTFFQHFSPLSKLQLEFNSDANVTLFDKRTATISVSRDNVFSVLFLNPTDEIIIIAKSLNPFEEPTIKSIKIDGLEVCKNLTEADFQLSAISYRSSKGCGKPQIFYTELIHNGALTKPGDWPWHVALYRQDFSTIKYICGGTLISKYYVLSAAHCVTIKGKIILAETLSVVLGKYNLKGGDFSSEEREVYNISVHTEFRKKYLENDIALLKLRTEVTYNDYIQPACLWHKQVVDKIPSTEMYGTVVGWGFDHTDKLSPQLQKAVLPILPDYECIRSNRLYYSMILNGKNFCAGLTNGTSPCNGDSGGGFVIFVPDKIENQAPNAAGSWYIRGIVSTTIARPNAPICDPKQNAVFTDVAKYVDWIETIMENS